ncbi:MAG: MFS transporter [Patescibacteria group bacterium]|jgi:MFS family permease|nr:MFS transporter [Patescibacteria group bacterium]
MDRKKLSVLILLASAQFILTLDSTFMNVSISTLVKDLHTSVTAIQGAIAFYSLVMASLMIAGAKIGDIIGRKKAFLIGLIIYGIGSFITSLSWNIYTLAFGWSFLEGVGAALVMPALFSMVVANFSEGKERVKAYGIIAAMAAAGAALGPIIGGFLTAFVSWRVGFLAEVFVAAFILINHKKIKDAIITMVNKKFDYVGLLLSGLGMFTIVFGILLANTYGIIQARKAYEFAGKTLIEPGQVSPTVWYILIGIGILFLFIIWEMFRVRKAKATLLNPVIFKNTIVTFGIVTTLSIQFVMAGTIFAISIVSQIILEYDAFKAGLVLLPLSIAVLIIAFLVGRIAANHQPKHIVQFGMLLILLGAAMIGILLYRHPSSLVFLPGLAFIGAGVGMAASMLNNLIVSSVTAEKTSEASGLNSTFLNLGASLGTAIAGSLIISIFIGSSVNLINNNAVFSDSQKTQLTQAVETKGQTLSNTELDQYLTNVPINIKNEILTINTQAENNATSAAIFSLAVLGTIGLISSSLLPKKSIS